MRARLPMLLPRCAALAATAPDVRWLTSVRRRGGLWSISRSVGSRGSRSYSARSNFVHSNEKESFRSHPLDLTPVGGQTASLSDQLGCLDCTGARSRHWLDHRTASP